MQNSGQLHVIVSASGLCSIFLWSESSDIINTAFCFKTKNTSGPPETWKSNCAGFPPSLYSSISTSSASFWTILSSSCLAWPKERHDTWGKEFSGAHLSDVTLMWYLISPACGALIRWMFFLTSLISAAFSSSLPFFNLWKYKNVNLSDFRNSKCLDLSVGDTYSVLRTVTHSNIVR